MKKLLRYLKEFRMECILAPLFKMFEAGMDLIVPLVMATLIDSGIRNADTGVILRQGLILVGLGLLGLAFSFTAQYFSARAAVGFAARLRHEVFAHLQALSFTQADTIGTSTMITRLTSDTNQLQSGVNLTLRLFLRSPFIVFGAMIMAFTVDAKAALVFVGVIPLLSIVVFAIILWGIPRYRSVQAALDRVLGITRENLTGVRVIRAFGKEADEVRDFRERNASLTDLQLFVGKVSSLMNPVTFVLINAATLILIYSGAIRVDEGALTQGQVIALVNYMSQILVELVKFANLIVSITKAVASGNRVQAVLDVPIAAVPTELPDENTDSPAVEFDHVSLVYEGAGAESLTDISFLARRGETIGIIGGTGSGKSSVVNLIPGFYPATSGTVRIHGLDVRSFSPAALKSILGIVPQKAVLFKGTIRSNLLWGKEDATEEEIWEALTLAQAAEIVKGKPEGLDAPVEQGGRNLSGGQKQRLTIARALVKKPEILILDDSASALDFATDAALRKALRSLSDMTVFLVSQRASSLMHADRILVLDDGRAVGLGTHDELLASCEVYQEIYYSQFPKEVTAE